MDVALFVFKGVKRLQDGGLGDEVLSLCGEARLADGGCQINGTRIASARRLDGIHEVVFDLVQLELDLVPGLRDSCLTGSGYSLPTEMGYKVVPGLR